MLIKIMLVVLCSILWRLGGWGKESGNPVPWKGWRVVLIPIILGLSAAWFMKRFWYMRIAVGLATIASMNIIRIGYGNYDPEHDSKPSFLAKVTHDWGGWWIRAIAGALYVLIGYLPYALYSQEWNNYFILTAISFLIGYCISKSKLNDVISDSLIGFTLAIFLLKI